MQTIHQSSAYGIEGETCRIFLPLAFNFVFARKLMLESRKILELAGQRGASRLVFDFLRVQTIDAAAIGSILVLSERAEPHITTHLENLSGQPGKLLALAEVQARIQKQRTGANLPDYSACIGCRHIDAGICDASVERARDCLQGGHFGFPMVVNCVSACSRFPNQLPAR